MSDDMKLVMCACVTHGTFKASPMTTRFERGDIVDMSDVGGPYEVVGEPTFEAGRWWHPCRIPLWHPQAEIILEGVPPERAIRHWPGTHLRRHVHER